MIQKFRPWSGEGLNRHNGVMVPEPNLRLFWKRESALNKSDTLNAAMRQMQRRERFRVVERG